MNRFSRIRHHVSVEDVKKKHLESIAVENFIRTEEEISKLISEKFKHNWRKELEEGMTTSNALSTVLPAEGEVAIDQVNPTDSASFADTNNMFGSGADNPAFVDAQIRASGSGTGSSDGFNVGGNYLAFQGGSGSSRMALLKPMDATKVDTLTITAIRGTGSNGGEHPDVVGTEELFVIYKTPEMSRSSYLSQDRSQNNIGAFPADAAIIAIDQGDGTLQNYSITIPEYARQKDVIFGLFQLGNSGSQYDHYGVTDIKFQRKTPINVVVPLDSPEAISFVRVGTNEGDPKKRKKKINDQLAASDEYTSQQMGGEFPGQGARIDGEDPFKSAEVQDVAAPSPLGKPAVTKSFADFQKGPEKVEVLKTPEQIEAQKTEYYSDLNNVIERGEYSYDDPLIAEIADKIIKLDPTSTDAYFYKSAYYDMTGEPEKALKVIDQLIKNNPNSSNGYLVRSYYKEESGDLAGAIEDIEKSIELDPDQDYIAYLEMDLADLKFKEAEVESNNAEKDRIESEAAAIQEKAHKDYWDNADLLEQEQEEVEEPAEYEFVDDFDGQWKLINDLQGVTSRSVDPKVRPSLHRIAADWGSSRVPIDLKVSGDNLNLADIYQKAESWTGTREEFANAYTDWAAGKYFSADDEWFRTDFYNRVVRQFGSKPNPKLDIAGRRVTFGKYNTSNVKGMDPQELIGAFEDTIREYQHDITMLGRHKDEGSSSKSVAQYTARVHNLAKYLKVLSDNLPDYYFSNFYSGVPDAEPKEPINTLYDQMKALYDEKDPEKEIKTELNELGFDKQYKDLMTAWDSADKFSKFITPLKNLSDALLGSKTAQNAKYENYKIAIAKSIMLNKPIRVNPDTIDPALIKKLGDRITPNQILSYDEEQRFKKMQETYAKLVKEGKGDPSLLYDYDQPLADGIPLIPIVSEPVPYADENIYEDEFGRVFTNDGSVANTTMQPDRAYHGFASAYAAEVMKTNPIAGRGQAQYQIVVPPDGSEPYLLYKDHAYHNVKSADKGEVPGFMNKGAAGFVNWLGNTAHARSDGDANTGGMAGYPPNIRGDVITEFRIPIADLSKQVQESVYRHKMMTENPDLVQVLRDYFYTEDKVKTFNIGGMGAKGLHNLYTNVILKRADQLKDFITDNRVELVLRGIGKITGVEDIGNITTASNMLQRYDDYIQQTIYTSDGKAYVPGVTTPDGNVISRININDQFTKSSQNKLQSLMSDKEIQTLVKRYVDMGKTEEGKKQLGEFLNLHIGNKGKLGFALSNSLGGGAQIDIDEFLNGRLVIKKNYEFRHDETIDDVGINYDLSKGLLGLFGVEKKGLIPIAKTMANLFDVSNDAWAHHDNVAVATLVSVATMGAARQLLRPVRNQGQSFAEAMNVAPTMPYKLEFDVSEKIMKILQGIEETDPRSGIAGLDEPVFFDPKKKNNKNNSVKESTLFERVKSKQFFNPKDIKPTFPENPPPEIDKKTGMHPNYGKQAKRYNKLDPISANSMPPTGDPEIDAVVDKQRTKKKPAERKKNYIKLSKVSEGKKYNWREDFTNITTGNKVGQTFRHNPSGQTVTTGGALGGIETVPSTVSIFGDGIPGPTVSQYGLQGFAKPILMKRRKAEDTNQKLEASQEFAKKANADVMMNARVTSDNDPNIISRTNTARKVLMDYLTGKISAGRWNEYLGKNYINYALKNATLNPDGSVTVGDNVIGGARNIEYDKASGTYKINFMGMGFQTNESEFAKNPAAYDEFWKSVFNKLGKYSADAQPQFHVPTRVLQGWMKLLNIGAGGIFGKVIEYYKSKGTAIDVNAFIEFSPEELFKLNPQLGKDYIQQKFGLTGEVWSPRMMGSPKGSDPKVTHNYYALYGKLPPRSVVKGSVPYNFGDHPEYDPKTIENIDKMRKGLSATKNKDLPKDVQQGIKNYGVGFDRGLQAVARRIKKKKKKKS